MISKILHERTMIAEVLLLLLLQQTGWAFKLSARKAVMGKDMNIPCSFTDKNYPIDRKFLAITWYFQGKEILSVQNTVVKPTDPRMSYTGRAEDGIADLSIANITIMDGGIYKCSIHYKTEKKEEEVRLDVQALPQITITDKVVVKNKESSVHSVISGFYPVDIDIKWFRDGEILNKVITEKPQRGPDGTYSVRSSVTIIPTKEDRERIFSYRVQHESLTAPLQEDFQLVYGAIPSVHITSQALKLNVEQNLVCSASEFYPESITVKWFLNDTLLENTKTRRISSSVVESVYHFIPIEENWGMELSCVVEHGTLTTPHVEKLLIQATDLTAKYKLPIPIASAVLVLIFGALTIALLYIKQREKRLPKVRNITRSPGCTFSLNVDHFYPEAIEVLWELVQPPSSTQPRAIGSDIIRQRNQDGTFNATSTCETLRGLIKDDQAYVVRAEVVHRKLKYKPYREWRSYDKANTDLRAQPQVAMVQIPKLFVKEQTQLRCTMSHFYPDELTVDWFMKENGKEELTPIANSGRYKIPNTESQLQPDKTYTNTAVLDFTPLMEDVESEIICRVSHPSLEEPIARTTGPLQVLAKPELQQPIKLSVTDSGDVVGHLTLVNFYPKNINVAWNCNLLQNGMTSEKVTDNPDGTFTLDSQYNISGKLFANPQFNMKVTWKHEAMEESEYREVSVQDPDFPWRPRIEDICPLILQKGKETKVTCKISGYFPENLKVTWLQKNGKYLTKGRQMIHQHPISDIIHERMADNTFQCSPSLSFTPTSAEEDLEFICRVEHPSLGQPLERSTGPPRINVPPQEPIAAQFTIHESDKVLCSLSLMKFYPKNINIRWSYGEFHPKTLTSSKKIIETDDDKTLDALSECIVPLAYFKSLVCVTWTHDSLKEARWRDLRITDFPWHPVIEQIGESSLVENTNAKLQFKISHYFPNDLDVTWHKKEKNGKLNQVLKYGQDTSRAQLQPDRTYSCTTSILVTPSLPKDQGSEFICRVMHPTLGKPIERSTGPLQVCARPTYQDPIQWSRTNRGEAALILHLHRFYPESIEIKWSCSCGISLTSENNYQNNADTTFNVTSECRVPQQHMIHQDPTIRVTWKHVTMADPESREVCVRDSDFPWRPKVTEISNPVLLLGQPVTVKCDICDYYPHSLTVTWYVKERGSQEYVEVDRKRTYKIITSPQQYSDSGYFSSTAVQFLPSLFSHQGVMFMCQVEHSSLENPIKRMTEPLFITLAPALTDSVKLLPCETGEVLCSIRLEKFFPKNIDFTWTFGGTEYNGYTPKKTFIVDDEVETFSAISECRIPWKLLKFPVQVSWEHESMREPQCKELPGPDFPWLPHIEVLDPACLILNTESKIQCRISGYFPTDLTVNWFKKKENTDNPIHVTNDRKYKIPNLIHHRQPDNTYSCTASLLFTPTQMDQGLEFICSVGHPRMEHPIEKIIRPLQMMGLLWRPHIDSLVISDQELEAECKIQCTVSGYSPDNVTITWLKKPKRKDDFSPIINNNKYNIPDITHHRQPDNTYSCTAVLLITSLQKEDQSSEFMCRVQHPSLDQPIERRTEPLQTKPDKKFQK